jgi:hypothetical protein
MAKVDSAYGEVDQQITARFNLTFCQLKPGLFSSILNKAQDQLSLNERLAKSSTLTPK